MTSSEVAERPRAPEEGEDSGAPTGPGSSGDVPSTRLRDLWPYVRPHRRSLVLALVLSLLGSAATIAQPLVVADIVDSFASGIAPAMMILLAVLLVFSALLTCLQQLILERSSERLVFDMRLRLISHVLRLPIGVLEHRRRGDLVSRVSADTSAMRRVLSQGAVELCASLLTVLAALVLMAILDPVLLGIVIVVVIALLVSVVLIGGRTRGAAHQLQTRVGRIASRMERALGGIRTIRATLSTDREVEGGVREASGVLRAGLRVAWLKAVVSSFSGIAVQVILLAVVGLGALRVAAGALTVGELSAFVMYMMLIVTPIALFAGIVTSFGEALGAFGRVREVLALPTESRGGPSGERDSPGRETFSGVSHEAVNAFEFDGVSFRYDGVEEGDWALQDIDLTISAGKVTAVVGPSGAGKSTLFGLMERFYDPGEGTIRFLGEDVRSLSRDAVRAHLAYVEQDAPALSGTVRDNLLLGSHEATDEECAEALRLSNLLPNSVDHSSFLAMEVGENGALLSGGERQRLAIARALLSEADVLLLDEATSHLDGNNEHSLQKALDHVSAHRTVVVIAHRLSTVRHADTIVVMEEGRIVARGNHAGLLDTSPLYRELVEHQQLDGVP